MKGHKRTLYIIYPLLLAFVCSGCGRVWAETRPIDEVRLIETVGYDTAPEGVVLSICAKEPQLRLSQEAASIRLAMDALEEQGASAALFYAHTRYLLLGQDAAEQGLGPVLDYVARSSDMRLRTPLFILKDDDAADAVQLGDEDTDVTDMLSALEADTQKHGTSHAYTCGEILQALTAGGCALAAACELEDDALHAVGYAILKDGKCVDWITAPEDLGVDLLLELGGHGDVLLGADTVTVEGCESRIRGVWDGDRLTGLDISLSLRARLTEAGNQSRATDPVYRRELERQLAGTVQGWAEQLLAQSQALEADFLGLGGILAAGNPGKWASIRKDWDAIFPTLPASITVEAELDRTLDLQDPLPLTGGNT